MNPQTTNPAGAVQESVEDVTYGIDTTAQLSAGQTPQVVDVTLTDARGVAVTLTYGPTVTGNVISQRIPQSLLVPARSPYLLRVRYTPSGTTNVLALELTIQVPV